MNGNQPNINLAKELIFYFVLLAGLGWLLFTFQVLLAPLVVAGLIAYLLYPIVSWLARVTRIKRRWIVPVVYLLFLLSLSWALVYLVPLIITQAAFISGEIAKLPVQLEEFEIQFESITGYDLPFESLLSEMETGLAQVLNTENLFRIIQRTTTNVVWIIIIMISSYHLLRDWENLRNWLYSLFPENQRGDIRRLHLEIKAIWQSYLRGQLLIMTILALLSGIGAAIIGVPGAVILGFLAGALALVPSIGPAIATAIAGIVAWTQGSTYLEISNLSVALIVVIIFQGIQAFEGLWLTPRIMGWRLKIHPGFVLIAIVGSLFTVGALLALVIVPSMGSIGVVARYLRLKRAGLDPWDSEEDMKGGETLELPGVDQGEGG